MYVDACAFILQNIIFNSKQNSGLFIQNNFHADTTKFPVWGNPEIQRFKNPRSCRFATGSSNKKYATVINEGCRDAIHRALHFRELCIKENNNKRKEGYVLKNEKIRFFMTSPSFLSEFLIVSFSLPLFCANINH
jgi:hypothetical protein